MSLFADDTLLYASNRNYKYAVLALQRQLSTTQDWFTKRIIQLNVSKTVAVIFEPLSQNYSAHYMVTNHKSTKFDKHITALR